jgi:hypothetical protein
MVVFNHPVEGQEDEYHRWYEQQHLSDVLDVPGFVAAQRYRLTQTDPAPTPPPDEYVTVYEIETDDFDQTCKTLAERVSSGAIATSGALQPPSRRWFFDAVGPRHEADTPGA